MKRFCMWEVGANKRGERVLLLIVKRADFNVMVTGEKAVVFRKKTRYWDAILTHEDGRFREFDYVMFQLGYGGSGRSCRCIPRFRVPWVDTTIVTEHKEEWRSGVKVAFTGEEFYAISLGPVCSTRSSAGSTRVCPYRGGCSYCKRFTDLAGQFDSMMQNMRALGSMSQLGQLLQQHPIGTSQGSGLQGSAGSPAVHSPATPQAQDTTNALLSLLNGDKNSASASGTPDAKITATARRIAELTGLGSTTSDEALQGCASFKKLKAQVDDMNSIVNKHSLQIEGTSATVNSTYEDVGRILDHLQGRPARIGLGERECEERPERAPVPVPLCVPFVDADTHDQLLAVFCISADRSETQTLKQQIEALADGQIPYTEWWQTIMRLKSKSQWISKFISYGLPRPESGQFERHTLTQLGVVAYQHIDAVGAWHQAIIREPPPN